MGKSGNPAKRAEQEAPVEYDPTPIDAEGIEDFDAFWQEQEQGDRRIPVRIRGEVYHLPPALPLQFDLLARKKKASRDPKDTERLLALLFGKDALKKWAEAGMLADEFAVLLAYCTQRIGGGNMSMAEVAAKLEEAEGKDPR